MWSCQIAGSDPAIVFVLEHRWIRPESDLAQKGDRESGSALDQILIMLAFTLAVDRPSIPLAGSDRPLIALAGFNANMVKLITGKL